mgnify:CR=1 FL=1
MQGIEKVKANTTGYQKQEGIWDRIDNAFLTLSWDELVDEIQGFGEVSAKKLEKKYGSPLTLAFMPSHEVTDLSPDVVAKIRKYLFDKFIASQFITANELRKRTLPRLSLQVPSLDDLLDIRPGDLILLYGPPSVGKTQFCHHASASVMLPLESGGYEGVTLYIDTEGTFDLDRVQTIYESLAERGTKKVFDTATVYKFTLRDPNDFVNFVYFDLPRLFASAVNDKTPIRLIIVDSFIAPFREKFSGRGTLAPRQQMMAQVLGFLKDIALLLQVPVILTTQIVARPVPYGKQYAAAGGNTLLHNVTKIVELDFVKEEVRRAFLVKGGKPRYAYFVVSDGGIEEAKQSVILK